MSDTINLLQNDPLVFIIGAIATVSLFSLFIFAIYFNFIPAKIASQYRQIRERSLMYFGLLGIVSVLITLFIAFLFAPGFAQFIRPTEVKQTEVQILPFTFIGTLAEIDEPKNLIKIEAASDTKVFVVLYNQKTKFLKENQPVSKSEFKKGGRISVTGKEVIKETGQFIAKEVNILPQFPRIEPGAIDE